MKEWFDALVSFSHWDYIGIALFVFFILAVSLEMSGLLASFSSNNRSVDEQVQLQKHSFGEKWKDFLWYINLLLWGLVAFFEKHHYLDKLLRWALPVLVIATTGMLIIYRKFVPSIIKKEWDKTKK